MATARLSFIIWAALAAFATYACMYAFRKPLSAATFEGLVWGGVSYKVLSVISQVLGYLSAKFIGIKFISELGHRRRRLWLLLLMGGSHLALLLFALTPFPYGFIWLFFNGLPLGLIWGLVFSYIEGRRSTDLLAVFLSISFIVSSGLVKSVGRWLIEWGGVDEFWMPFCTGALFVPLLLLSSWMLERLPPPDAADKAERSERVPLDAAGRRGLFRSFAPGLTALLLLNLAMTVGRDIKDNFLVEIWQSLSVSLSPGIYTQTESLVGLLVLLLLGLMALVRGNHKALYALHALIALGLVVVLVSTALFQTGLLGPFLWMTAHGVGLYLSYIAFQSLYFERFIAAFKIAGNVGFLIYLSDFLGYLGSCCILLMKELGGFSADWKVFFVGLSYGVAALGLLVLSVAHLYFVYKMRLSSKFKT